MGKEKAGNHCDSDYMPFLYADAIIFFICSNIYAKCNNIFD